MIKIKNYEILKETKIIYEYLNDILSNANFEINKQTQNTIHQTINIIKDMYENTYNLMNSNSEERDQLKTNCNCPHCSNDVVISDLIDYAYLCEKCDENMYLGEGDLNYEWYFNDNKDDPKLDKSFMINVDYNNKTKDVYIATESSSGAKYKCNSLSSITDAINTYIYDYEIGEEYYIKIWETEEDRTQGEPFEHLKTYYDKNSAIEEAKKILSRQDYAYLEVIRYSDEEVIFASDGNEEEYFCDGKKINYVEEKVLKEYIDNWNNHKELPIYDDLIYTKEEDKYIAVDNTSGDCWVEKFDSKEKAIKWLLGEFEIGEEEEDEDELLPY